jgi:hypothetical protein
VYRGFALPRYGEKPFTIAPQSAGTLAPTGGDMESNRWLLVAFLAGGLLIGAGGYAIGLSQGAAAAAAQVDSVTAHYGWGHYWGFFPFGGILMLFFWLWIFRALFWGFRGPWGWRRRWRSYDYYDDPRWFDEWHRRAHERDEQRKV